MIKMILNFIFPPRCVFCQTIIGLEKKQICGDCKNNVKAYPIIQVVFKKKKFISYCISPFKYDGKVKDAVWKFKFENQKNYSKIFSEIILEVVEKDFYEDIDLIAFVPLSKKKTIDRGYNQAESLAREISFRINVPCESVFFKTKENKPQHTLAKKFRVNNVKGVYELKSNINIKGKKVLLCDDVITTGSTLRECIKILYKSNVKKVFCCTFAAVI